MLAGSGASTKLLVLSRSVIGPRMASPGVRAYQIAGALARALPESEVTLGMPAGQDPIGPPEPNVRLQAFAANAEAAFLAGQTRRHHQPELPARTSPGCSGKTRFALDGFTPLYVEWMELSKRDILPKWRRTWMASNRWYLNMQLSLADFVFCADERQRDLWIGMLMALALVPVGCVPARSVASAAHRHRSLRRKPRPIDPRETVLKACARHRSS